MRRIGFLLVFVALTAGCSQNATAPSTTGAPATDTFASTLVVGGATSHAFTTLNGGTITVTLTSTVPGGVVVGLGIGIPSTGTSKGCALNRAVATAAGAAAQITASVDQGTYCVEVYDVGTLTDALTFSVAILHP